MCFPFELHIATQQIISKGGELAQQAFVITLSLGQELGLRWEVLAQWLS